MTVLFASSPKYRISQLLAKCVALNAANCPFSQLEAPQPTSKNTTKCDDKVDKFVDCLVTSKRGQWHNKNKPRVNTKKCPQILADVRTKTVLQEDECASKEKIFPLVLLQDAINNHFNKEQILKIIESPEILSKVQPELIESLAHTFIRIDFTEGVLKLEATSQQLKTPLVFNFIGQQFRSYHNANQNTKALALVEKYYVEYPNSRREARSYLASIIRDVVGTHSEAVLVQCKQLVLRLEKSFQDSRPLIFLWHACFSSEWFSDQQLSKELLAHISKSRKLVETLDKKLMTATHSALGRHRPELVQNLVEDLIANNLKSHLTVPLRLLFDYRCSMGDLRGCAAIMKSSVDLKIILTSQQHSNFLELLTHKKHFRWKQPPSPQNKIESVEFKFKF